MSIYESLRQSSVSDFGYGERFESYPHIPCLNADQPAELVGLTAPDKRPSPETLNLAPPFERFFVECRLPKSLRFPDVGILAGEVIDMKSTIIEIGMDVSIHKDPRYVHTPEDMRPRWSLRCLPFYSVEFSRRVEADPLCISNFELYVTLGADGIPVVLGKADEMGEELEREFLEAGCVFWTRGGLVYGTVAKHRWGGTDEWRETLKKTGAKAAVDALTRQFDLYIPLLYAINSLHNKRTVVVQNQPSRQVRRAAQRSGKQTPNQRTIVISDFVKIVQGARKAQSEGHQYPLCEVIGHYANYGVNGRTGLLFGKYRGTFFVPSFLKGNPDVGATDHDYDLWVGKKACA